MKSSFFDVVIVGSGPSGVHAAYPLVKAGLRVAIIDGCLENSSTIKVNQLLKIKSNIEIIQSLAKGGLSEVWPGICDYFTSEELTKIGLPTDEILREYKVIAKLINLNLKPPLDIHVESILDSERNVYQLPQTFSYRTSSVIDDFKKFKNFTYFSNQLVLKVKEKKGYAEIQSYSINNLTESYTKARFIILAAGSINTTRILLRSFNLYNYKTPFLTKRNYAIICLHTKTLIKKAKLKTAHPGQVAISNNDYFIQFYKCNPFSLHKALPYIPLPKTIASLMFAVFTPHLIIADVRFTTLEGKKKFYRLKKASDGDILEIFFHQTNSQLQNQKRKLNKIKKKLLCLGLIPLKTIQGDVTSHYGGGVPNQTTPGMLSTDSNGKLHQAKRIYIADSSIWRALPAKPPTLTIMANASRVGKQVLAKFKYLTKTK